MDLDFRIYISYTSLRNRYVQTYTHTQTYIYKATCYPRMHSPTVRHLQVAGDSGDDEGAALTAGQRCGVDSRIVMSMVSMWKWSGKQVWCIHIHASRPFPNQSPRPSRRFALARFNDVFVRRLCVGPRYDTRNTHAA